MAYEKQTWTDNVSPLNAERMNHIEDGVAALSEEMVTQIPSKNLNVLPYESKTASGVTMTANADNSLTFDGVCEGEFYAFDGLVVDVAKRYPLPAGTYTVSGTVKNTLRCYAVLYKSEDPTSLITTYSDDTGEGKTFTIDENCLCAIQVSSYSGKDVSGMTIYPQLEAGEAVTEFASPFIPRTVDRLDVLESTMAEYAPAIEAAENAMQKDYFTVKSPYPSFALDVSAFANAVVNVNGEYILSANAGNGMAASPEYYPVDANKRYLYAYESAIPSFVYMYFYTAEDEATVLADRFVDRNRTTRKLEFTAPVGAKYVRIYMYYDYATYDQIKPTLAKIIEYTGGSQDLKDTIIQNETIDVTGLHEIMWKIGLIKQGQPIPSYYLDTGYLQGKCARIVELYNACAGNGDAFIFVTDQHWPLNAQNSPALMRYIADKTLVPMVFSGGDTDDCASEPYAMLLANEMDNRVHHCVGNHDVFGDVDGNQVARIFDAGKVDQIGNAYRHYYYVDNAQQKIRYVVLSPYDNNPSGSAAIGLYEADQITWLTNTALDVEEGWTVIVFTHCLYYGSADATTLPASPSGADDVIAALDAATCDIACVIQGHMHLDRICHTPGGIPVVATTCDKYMPWMSGETNNEPWLSESRTLGTITEQAFDVVVLDKAARKLTFVRIGAPADNWTDGTSTGTVEERVVTY